MKIIKIDEILTKKELNEVEGVLGAGGIVVFPTETVYGMGTCFSKKKSVEKIYEIKGRDFNKPLPIFISEISELNRFAEDFSKDVEKIIKKYWPGPLTVIFRKNKNVPDWITRGGDTVGIRFPDSKVSLQITKSCGGTLTATSANISRKGSHFVFKDVMKELKDKVDLAIDGGKTFYKKESTVLDATGPEIKILREGVIGKTEIFSLVKNS